MGRAMVRDPQVFLFDEPLSNLDAKLRVAMRIEIKELHQRLKTTTIYVTHDQIEAMTMADKIVVMHDGRVEQIGTPLHLYDKPDNQFVAGFIGSPAMNLLKGAIAGNGRIEFIGPGGESAAAAGSGKFGRSPGGLRNAARAYNASRRRRAGLEVQVVEPTGSEIHVLGKSRRRGSSSQFFARTTSIRAGRKDPAET